MVDKYDFDMTKARRDYVIRAMKASENCTMARAKKLVSKLGSDGILKDYYIHDVQCGMVADDEVLGLLRSASEDRKNKREQAQHSLLLPPEPVNQVKSRGRPTDSPKKPVSVHLDTDLIYLLRTRAIDDGCSYSEVIRKACWLYVSDKDS